MRSGSSLYDRAQQLIAENLPFIFLAHTEHSCRGQMPAWAISIPPYSTLTRSGMRTNSICAAAAVPECRSAMTGTATGRAPRASRSLFRRAADRPLLAGRSGSLVGLNRQVQEPHLLDSCQARHASGCSRYFSVRMCGLAFGIAAPARTPRLPKWLMQTCYHKCLRYQRAGGQAG